MISDMDPSHAERPHSIYIQNRIHNDRWELAATSSSSLADWWSGLEQHFSDQGYLLKVFLLTFNIVIPRAVKFHFTSVVDKEGFILLH